MRRPGRLPSTTWTASRLPARTWLSRYSSPGSWATSVSRNAERRDGRNAATRRPSSRHASPVATCPSAAGSWTSRGRSVHAAGMNVPARSRTRSTTRHGNNASSSRATPRRATPPARPSTAPSQAADRNMSSSHGPCRARTGCGRELAWQGRLVTRAGHYPGVPSRSLLRATCWSCRSCTSGSQSPNVADGPSRGSLRTSASRRACRYARSWSIRACT
jgi:hypothetical protein